MNAETFLCIVLFGFILLIIVWMVLQMLYHCIVTNTIFIRKNPKFRIVERVRRNTLNPPGTRTRYSIEGKTIYGFWVCISYVFLDKEIFETIKDARNAKFELEYNANNKWVESEDFKDIVSEINRNGIRVKINERKRCCFGHYISRTEDPDYSLVNVVHRFEDVDKENPIDISFYKEYRLYKKRLWWWHKVSGGRFKDIDELARELNTEKEYRRIVN